MDLPSNSNAQREQKIVRVMEGCLSKFLSLRNNKKSCSSNGKIRVMESCLSKFLSWRNNKKSCSSNGEIRVMEVRVMESCLSKFLSWRNNKKACSNKGEIWGNRSLLYFYIVYSTRTNLHISNGFQFLITLCTFLKLVHQLFNVDPDFSEILVHVIPINFIMFSW